MANRTHSLPIQWIFRYIMKTNIWQQFTEATTEANESENEDWEEANVVANQWESQKLIKNVPEST